MLVNMLRAVSTMLDSKESDVALAFKAKVDCAKVMLDEIIKSMESEPRSEELIPLPIDPNKKEVALSTRSKPIPRPKDKYKVVVGANSALQKIEGLEPEGKVIVDGKPMTHQQAIGKSFTTITLPND